MDILGQSALFAGLTSFAFGFSILARNTRNKLFIAFAGLCSMVAAWALSFFLEKIWSGVGFYRLHLSFNVWLAPVALLFIQIMIRVQNGFSRRLFETSIIAALSLTVAIVFRYDITFTLVRQLVYFAPGFVLIQIVHLMWMDRRLRRGIKRLAGFHVFGFSRRNLIYFGGVIILMTSVMDHIPQLGLGVPAFGNLALSVYLFFLSQAISQQRLLNFGALLSRFMVLIAVALTLTGVYSLLVAWIQNSPGLFFLNSFIASFLILMLLDPLRLVVGSLTQRLLTKQHLRLQELLKDSQRKLTGVVDIGSLFQTILLTVEQVLQPERAALFVLRSYWTKYRRVRMLGPESQGSESPREMLANHNLLQYCSYLHHKGDLPVLLDQIIENEIDRSASREQRAYLGSLIQGLKALECNLLIPLFDSGQILGFVTIYASAPPEPWGANWGLLSVLYPFFEQAAQTLRNMEVYVRQREKERLATIGEMAAGLAHEIRNPLGAIKGAAQYLDPSVENDRPDSRFLRVIVEEVDRLNRVVTQFLDYSKPNSVEFKPVDMSLLVSKTIELLRPSIRPEIKLEFQPSKHLATAAVAPEQIQQVILNLVQNSIKALDAVSAGRVRIGVDIEGDSRHHDVVVSVEDNGPGIKREHLDKIFIPFFTTSPSGTGLGLSICQKIIEAHRGRIEVVSEEGRFTRFSVILPIFEEKSNG